MKFIFLVFFTIAMYIKKVNKFVEQFSMKRMILKLTKTALNIKSLKVLDPLSGFLQETLKIITPYMIPQIGKMRLRI